MGRKIFWQPPEQTNVTDVGIYRATNKYSVYTPVATVDATDDGEIKSTTNNWATSYTDASGTFTDWYKIKFSDGTYYSDYSDPITGETRTKLCTVDEVKQIIDTVGRWDDSEIYDAIQIVEENMIAEMGKPINAIWSEVGRYNNVYQYIYYLGEENIYRIDRLFYGTTTKVEYFLDDGFKADLDSGMIRILPVASGGPVLDTECRLEVRFVPKIYNRVAVYRTAKHLLEKIDYASGGAVSKELEVITNKVNNVERVLNQRIGMALSSDYKYYDPIYGVNKKYIRQDHDRNIYLSSVFW